MLRISDVSGKSNQSTTFKGKVGYFPKNANVNNLDNFINSKVKKISKNGSKNLLTCIEEFLTRADFTKSSDFSLKRVEALAKKMEVLAKSLRCHK